MTKIPNTRQPGRREQRTPPRHEDPYRSDAKGTEARCPRCGATFHAGRWTWRLAEGEVREDPCPACRRIERNDPAGYITLRGPFFAEHREEILARVHHVARRARDEHPLERIVSATDVADGVLVTTTDAHLVRAIAVAVHDAYQGDLDMSFGPNDSHTRAVWTR